MIKEVWYKACYLMRLYNKHISIFCIKHMSIIFRTLQVYKWYEVRDIFPWEMFTKMVISCLLNVENIWNSAQINLSSTLNFYWRYVFDATISTEQSTSEIDADLTQTGMQLYLIPSRQLNLSYANWYTCHRGYVVKWHTYYTYVKFPSAFSWNCDFGQFL